METKLIIEKTVFALVGEHVTHPQAKLQIDRTAKLQGDVIFFPSSETYFRYKHKNTNNLRTKPIIEKMVFALVGEHVPSPQAKLQLDRTANFQGDVNLFFFLRDLFSI